jgi:uroporphyrinogen-III synthase
LATQLSNAGLATDEAIIYRQCGLPLTAGAQQILCGTDPVIVPLFSPRSAQRFRAEFIRARGTAPIYVIALSKAVATEMSGINMADLVVAEQPKAMAMEKALNNLVATLMHLERAPITK